MITAYANDICTCIYVCCCTCIYMYAFMHIHIRCALIYPSCDYVLGLMLCSVLDTCRYSYMYVRLNIIYFKYYILLLQLQTEHKFKLPMKWHWPINWRNYGTCLTLALLEPLDVTPTSRVSRYIAPATT